jgi:RNA polymerase sigma factor (sigma-70 family)
LREEKVMKAPQTPRRSVEERNKLVEANLHLATYVAKLAVKRLPGLADRDWEDIRQEANVGLIKAAAGFDENRGCKFSTYACTVIYRRLMRMARGDRFNRTLLLVPFQRHSAYGNHAIHGVEFQEPEDHRGRLSASDWAMLQEYLDTLNPADRSVLVGSVAGNLTFREMSEDSGHSRMWPDRVLQRLARTTEH